MALETNLENARQFYYNQYPIITDRHIEEMIKLEILVPKVKQILEDVSIYSNEVRISNDKFIGIVDLITKNDDGTVDVFDFKYSNNVDNYLESAQLHIYKYFLEQLGFKVRKLGFIFVPKNKIRQKQTETLYQFRKRLMETTKELEIQIAEIEYDPNKVIEFVFNINTVIECNEYPKNPTNLCSWCEYENYCLKGEDYMILPENKRREKKIDSNPDLWIYAQSYVGKSTFIDQYEDLLFLNTDGNTDNTTAPVIPIANKVWYEGRVQKKQLAWEIFLEIITELEKRENDYKRVCIDLVEDLYEHCRLYVYDKYNWEHESDGGYGKGYDLVKTEFLSNMKRLKALGYQIIYISKEVVTEVTLKNGNKLTTYKPNIGDKVANVLAGTVDLTVRAYMKGEERFIQLAKDEDVFGGGRFNFKLKKCPLNMKDFTDALLGAQELIGNVSNKVETPKEERRSRKSDTQNVPEKQQEDTSEEVKKETVKEEKPKRRSRKAKEDESKEELAEEDKYYYHPESESYWILQKGEKIPTDFDAGLSNEITKEEYELGIKKQKETEDAPQEEEPVQEQPRRRRRSKKED